MLTMTMKLGDKVYIGDNMYVTFIGLIDGKYRVGFQAPKSVTILREALLSHERKQAIELAAKGE